MADGGDLPSGEGSDNICSFFASIIDQRQSVERLLNWLRESQTTCTDTNCFDEINGLPGTEQGAQLDNSGFENYASDNAFALVIWFVVGILTIYAMNLARDRGARATNMVATKGNRNSRNGSNNDDDDQSGRPLRRYNYDDDDHSRPAI